MSQYKAIVVCGPTASGKTSLALKLASDLAISDIISADSRQVYQHLDIVTGKDIPSGWRRVQVQSFQEFSIIYYTNGSIRLWGYDFVLPTTQFSVSDYCQVVTHIFANYLTTAPLIVGGSGWYLSALFSPPDTINIPPNLELRHQLSSLSVQGLQSQLLALNPDKLHSMNNSDQHNPRRLIRAIEVNQVPTLQDSSSHPSWETHWIGLKLQSLASLNQQIAQRVYQRVMQVDNELDFLTKQNLITDLVKHTLGYQPWLEFRAGRISWLDAVAQWVTSERQYAKRQMTWFRKQPHINWYTSPYDYAQIASSLREWYSLNT